METPLTTLEMFGLSPLRQRIREGISAFSGLEDVPGTRFGLSSASQLHPRLARPLWKGRWAIPNTAIVSNLFNRTPTPIEAGWSVRRTQIKDYRGKTLTYDSHNGVDFAVPVGTPITAAADGTVVWISSELNRGGLKVFLEHGGALMTTYAHLGRLHVELGQAVTRGQRIATSGYSGIDGVLTYPWGLPHLHFNVWHNSDPVDPFGTEGNPSLWLDETFRVRSASPEAIRGPEYDPVAVEAQIAACKTASVRDSLRAIPDPLLRAGATLMHMNYYPTRFFSRRSLYRENTPRTPRLTLPFPEAVVENVVYLDELTSTDKSGAGR